MHDFIVDNIEDFHLNETLECGQCFHFKRTDDGNEKDIFEYDIIACGRLLCLREEPSASGVRLIFRDTDESEYESVWKPYFDLDTDYSDIKRRIIGIDPSLEAVIATHGGIRILRQEFFETLISFIISQNKQIPQIKQVVRSLSEMCGGDYNAPFPTIDQLSECSEDDIRSCKAGFRAPYIMDAVRRVSSGGISEEALRSMSTEEARRSLITIKGVGEKVANCVLLYSLHRFDAFPVDVWMKRICEHLYCHKDTPKDVIERDMCEKFGNLAGIAQQYLFIYGRENGIGK